MIELLKTIIVVLLAYLLGSLPFAVIVSRFYGLEDPRKYGSGNPGATNVLRTGKKTAALLTLLGDAMKGWLAVVLAGLISSNVKIIALAGIAAFLGHLYSAFLRFKGGKGVATALGVLTGWSGWLALTVVAIWLAIAFLTRYSSLAALVAAAAAPVVARFIIGIPVIIAAVAVISGFLIWRHRANMLRLLSGTESRIGSKKKSG
jgi:glycerol-3-phosphate acyltransferase PlsY